MNSAGRQRHLPCRLHQMQHHGTRPRAGMLAAPHASKSQKAHSAGLQYGLFLSVQTDLITEFAESSSRNQNSHPLP